MSFIVCPTNYKMCFKDYIFNAVSFKLLGMFKGAILTKNITFSKDTPRGIILSTVFSCFHCVKIVD